MKANKTILTSLTLLLAGVISRPVTGDDTCNKHYLSGQNLTRDLPASFRDDSPITYSEILGLVSGSNGDRILDEELAQALSSNKLFKDFGVRINPTHLPLKQSLMKEIETQFYMTFVSLKTIDERLNFLAKVKAQGFSQIFYNQGLLSLSSVSVRQFGFDPLVFLRGGFDPNDIKNNIIKVTTEKISQFKDLNNLTELLESIKRSGIEEILPSDYLFQSPLVKDGFINPSFIELAATHREVRSAILRGIVHQSQNFRTFHKYFDLIEIIKNSDYSSNEIKQILSPMTKLGSEFGVIPDLINILSDSLKSQPINVSYSIRYELYLAMRIMHGDIPTQEIKDIKSGINFTLMIRYLIKNPNDELKIAAFLESPRPRELGLTRESLNQFIEKIEKKKMVNLKDISKAIEDEFPTFSLKGRLLQFDEFHKSVNIISFKNQCLTGTCWLQTIIASEEMILSNKLGRHVELSAGFIFSQFLRDMYKYVLKNERPSINDVVQGAYLTAASDLIKIYGIIPISYTPAGATKLTLVDELSNMFFSPDVQNEIKQQIMDIYSKKIARNSTSKNLNVSDLEGEIDSLFRRYYPIKYDMKFEFDGQIYQPKSFAKKYLPDIFDNSNIMLMLKDKDTPSTAAFYRKNNFFNLDYDFKSKKEIETVIKKSIDKNIPVPASLKWPNFISTQDFVTIDDNGYLKTTKNSKTFEEVKEFRKTMYGHAVNIVGYELNPDGSIKSYKLLNSWGRRSGNAGIYQIDSKYLQWFLMNIKVNKHMLTN